MNVAIIGIAIGLIICLVLSPYFALWNLSHLYGIENVLREYIERAPLLAAYDAEHVGPPGRARELIASAPAADVRPVVRGGWVHTVAYPHKVFCSRCFKTYLRNEDWAEQLGITLHPDFCLHCGADMRPPKEADHGEM